MLDVMPSKAAIRVYEILFLNLHPKGPQMDITDIADQLSINENYVRAICSRQDLWPQVFHDMEAVHQKDAIENDVSPLDDFEIVNSTEVGDKDKNIGDLRSAITEIALLKVKIRMNEKKMAADKLKMDAYEKEKADMVFMSKEKWIHLYQFEFSDYFQTTLNMSNRSSAPLQAALKKFYCKEKFTDAKHKELIKCVDYQKRLLVQMYGEKAVCPVATILQSGGGDGLMSRGIIGPNPQHNFIIQSILLKINDLLQ